MPTRTLTRIAVLSALSFALMLFEFPIPGLPAGKYDLSEVPGVLAALGMGPQAGLAVEVLKDLLFLASGRSQAGFVGVAANLLAGGTLVLATGLLGHRLGLSQAGAVARHQYWAKGLVAAAAGAAAMAAVMLVANACLFIPLFFKKPGMQWAMSMAWVPFNLAKGALAGAAGLALHRRLAPYVTAAASRAA